MNMKDLLAVAQKNHFAISALDIGSDQLLKVVTKKVKELNSLVILEMSPDEFDFVGDIQIQAMTYEAAQTDVPVCVHLDHEDSYETAVRIIRVGTTPAMIDASILPYEEDIIVMKKVVETAHIANVSVESELGTISTTGNSIEGGAQGVTHTVPEEVEQFIEDTGTDTSAVTIGTAHGIYSEDVKPELRIDTLKGITSKADALLVLRGGPSNKDKETAATIDNGICKINIPSNIEVVLYTQCHKTPNENPGYCEPLEICPEAMEVYGEVVEEKIRLFKSNDKMKYYY